MPSSRNLKNLKYEISYRKVVEAYANAGEEISVLDLMADLLGDHVRVMDIPDAYEAIFETETNCDQIPVWRDDQRVHRATKRPPFYVGEAIESLEFARLVRSESEEEEEEEDWNAQFNFGLTLAAILIRPEGVDLPCQRGSRDAFIDEGKEWFFDRLSYGDYLALTGEFNRQMRVLSENKEYQFFWKGRPQIRRTRKRTADDLKAEQLEAEIAAVLGLRQHYVMGRPFYQSFCDMFYADFTDFVFQLNLKIGVGG